MYKQEQSQPPSVWGKLIPFHPNNKTIDCLSNLFHEFKVDYQWTISHKPSGETWIRNESISYLKVDDTWLEFYDKKQLFGGEKLAFSRKKKEKETTYDYVFCFTNIQPKNELKRTRELPPSDNPSPQKLLKIIQEEEITCSICLEIFTRCATLSPCGHNFCGSCLILHLRKSLQCPLCKTRIVSVIKHSAFHNIIEAAVKNSPTLIPRLSSLNDELAVLQKDLEGNVSTYKGHVYIGAELYGQKHGQGTLVYPDGRLYQGLWKSDRKEGEGILALTNGVIITGKWLDDAMQPIIQIRYQNGDFYHGETKDFKFHGKGSLKFHDGGFYEGEFKEGLKEGFGKYVYKNGEEYEGGWVKGGRNGNGIMEYLNGDIYQGEWRKNKREGKGLLIKGNGDEYDGSWLDDCYNGVGKYTWRNGQEYDGSWDKGKASGFGIMKYVNGEIWKGVWGNDEQRQGGGVLALKNGDKIQGEWVDDKLQSQVQIKYSNGDEYKGEINIKTFQKQGEGVLTLNNGSQYDGHWVNDKFNGNGKFIRKENDCVFEALWENGTVLHSIMTCADGTQYKAEWKKVV